MPLHRRTLVAHLLAPTALALAGFAGPAAAQPDSNYPTRAIRMVVGFPGGGITDVIARAVANGMSQVLGQSVYVDNRPGAGTTIAADAVASATPDGYTILLTDVTTHAINASLYPKLPYDTVKSFTPIGMVASTPLMLVVNSKSPVKSVQELIAAQKAKPGYYGSSGNGTIIHLAGAMLASAGKIAPVHVPYKGSAPATTALLGGEIDFFFSSLPPALAQVKAGSLRALAVTTPKRVPSAPDVPTMGEAGVPNFSVVLYNGIMGPAGLPAPIVKKLNDALAKVLASPEIKKSYLDLGADVVTTSTGAQFEQILNHELRTYAPIVKATGAKVE
ncbi:MAG: tripartite tricarboxylate transporter substrate binding protein [Pseudomonadota bacterium]